MTNDCKTCPVSTGTHKPAEALHQQIDEPQPTALGYADAISAGLSYTAPHLLALAADELRAQHARIAELESQLEAIGAGGVEPLRKQASQQAVQAAVPVAWRLTNTAFRKPRFEYHDTKESAEQCQADFNRSVDDGGLHNLTPLYAAPAHSAEGVPALEVDDAMAMAFHHALTDGSIGADDLEEIKIGLRAVLANVTVTQPAAQGMESSKLTDKLTAALIAMRDIGALEDGLLGDDPQVVKAQKASRKALDAALAAQAKQGGAA